MEVSFLSYKTAYYISSIQFHILDKFSFKVGTTLYISGTCYVRRALLYRYVIFLIPSVQSFLYADLYMKNYFNLNLNCFKWQFGKVNKINAESVFV